MYMYGRACRGLFKTCNDKKKAETVTAIAKRGFTSKSEQALSACLCVSLSACVCVFEKSG